MHLTSYIKGYYSFRLLGSVPLMRRMGVKVFVIQRYSGMYELVIFLVVILFLCKLFSFNNVNCSLFDVSVVHNKGRFYNVFKDARGESFKEE